VKERTLKILVKHIDKNGAVPRVHGNKGQTPAHAVLFDDVQRVAHLLTNTADEFGLPQPAAPRNRADFPPIYIPSSYTKVQMHKEFINQILLKLNLIQF